jgi:PPM family protein phosphatase
MITVESASITDIGKKRKTNEDALIFEDALGLYVVADGMGGHRAGDVASRLVVETIGEYIKKSIGSDNGNQTADFDETLSHEANRLLSSIHKSNQVVHDASLTNKTCRGMGSTVSAVYLTDSTLIAANVGDSPIYLVRDDKIKLLSVPHTYLAEQQALNPENAQKLRMEFRHVLTRAVGTEKSVKADICEIQCFRNDIIVISSDGLNDKVSAEEILELVRDNEPEVACQKLVKMANDRGGDDNITVILLNVKLIKNPQYKINRFLTLVKRNSFRILTGVKDNLKLKSQRAKKCQT